MNRTAKVQRLALVAIVFLLVPASANAEKPDLTTLRAAGLSHWSADAELLARTAPQAVRNGTTDEECTGWRSTYAPPASIRVLRTRGPLKGSVEEVPFRSYVETVLPRGVAGPLSAGSAEGRFDRGQAIRLVLHDRLPRWPVGRRRLL